MTDIVVIGGGGHAKVVISVLKKLGSYRIIGYTDIKDRGDLLGVKYLGNDSNLPGLRQRKGELRAAIGIGNVTLSNLRKEVIKKISDYGCLLPPVVSPNAVVNENVSLGEGSIVMDGVVVNSGSIVGRGAILNTNCTVEHDCEIGDYVHVAPGATLSGGVKIGENSLIGAGATVIQYKSISPGCLVGAGATVVEHLLEPGTYVGNPARRINK